ncbi:hypothetical protein FB451DRAFT_1189672 [Mycena latifolia]|nr:hypothetical protein FB451DRAFT_1189672 [Mycena latifolia]
MADWCMGRVGKHESSAQARDVRRAAHPNTEQTERGCARDPGAGPERRGRWAWDDSRRRRAGARLTERPTLLLEGRAFAKVSGFSSSASAPAQTSQETGSPNTGSTQTVDRNGAPAGAIAASVVIVVLIFALAIFVWWWIRRRRQRIRELRFPAQFLESTSPVQRVVRSPSIIKVAAATDVETRAEVAETTMAQGVALDETQTEKGAPARTHNLRLINFSDVPAEGAAAQASNAQDAAHTEEAVTVRLRRVEAQLASLLTPAVESPEELPPEDIVERIRNEDFERCVLSGSANWGKKRRKQ